MSAKVHAASSQKTHDSQPTLSQSIDAAMKDKNFTDYGFATGLKTYAKDQSLAEIYEDLFGEELTDDLEQTKGKGAPAAVAEFIRSDKYDEDNDEEGINKHLDALAADVAKAFTPADFKKLVAVGHSTREDGDMMVQMLAGQKSDGSWQVFSYFHNPF